MVFRIKMFVEDPQIRELYAARKNFASDSGLDLFCVEDQTFEAQTLSNKIDLGVVCELVKVDENGEECKANCGYLLLPRSSIVKTPLRLANSIGVIDSGYRGHIIACVDAHKSFNIFAGDRYFQLCVPSFEPIELRLVDNISELSNTSRGDGGFGSTGK